MNILYKASATATGGRDGQVSLEHSPVSFEMALPPEMGGTKPIGFNPEQFFAAGYASCFGSALQHVFKVKKVNVSAPVVHTEVGIGRNNTGGYSLAVDIVVIFKAIDQSAAELLVAEAHQICPYSNATRDNIDVTISAKVE